MTLIDELRKHFPTGEINRLSYNRELYYRVTKEAKINNFANAKEYLESLGYEYNSGLSRSEILREVSEYLETSFPDKKVELREISLPMVYRIKKIGEIESVLLELGFTITNNHSLLKSSLDYNSIRRMNRDYFVSGADLGNLFDVSRQTINNIIHGNVNEAMSNDSWEIDELEDDEIELILDMIINHEREKKWKGMTVSFFVDGMGRIMILIFTPDLSIVRVIFDENIPSDIHELLDEFLIPFRFPDEEELFKNLEYVYVANHKYISNSKKNYKTKWNYCVKKNSKKRNITPNEYMEFLGVYGFMRHKYTFDYICEQLESVADENHAVSTTKEKVQAINRHFRHYRFDDPDKQPEYQIFSDFNDFLEYHGYHLIGPHGVPEEARIRRKQITDERYKSMLMDYRLHPKSNIVVFNYRDEIFPAINSIAGARGVSVSEYVISLGYEFIQKPHSTIFDMSLCLEESINEEKSLEEDFSSDIFETIYSEYVSQGNREVAMITNEQLRRNQILVNKMKSAYGCRCQLCSEDLYFDIEKEDGSFYVEVHHIIPNCEGEDEEGSLDRPGNMIVVCPNHHKYLHYHKGGMYRLFMDENKLVLKNDVNSIPIIKDMHLRKYNFQYEDTDTI